jgi:hypothetical protein
MRRLLRACLCAVVAVALGGCGSRDSVEIPKKFAPPPPKEQKPDIGSKAPTKGPPKMPAKGGKRPS